MLFTGSNNYTLQHVYVYRRRITVNRLNEFKVVQLLNYLLDIYSLLGVG